MQYSEIKTEIQRATRQRDDAASPIGHMINQCYLSEALQVDDLNPLYWLMTHYDYDTWAPITITGVTIGATGQILFSSGSVQEGDLISVYGITGTTELNNRTFKAGTVVANTSVNIQNLDGTAIDTSGMTAWSSGGTIHHRGVQVSSPAIRQIISATFHGKSPLRQVTPQWADEDIAFWSDSTTRPMYFFMRKGTTEAEIAQIIWGPCSDQAYDFRAWVERLPAPLSADADIPSLPTEFHPMLVAGPLTRLIESNVQVENAVIWPGVYKQHLINLAAHNFRWWERKLSTSPGLVLL
jgi:hypothetical protein